MTQRPPASTLFPYTTLFRSVVSQYIGTLRAVANVQASQSRVELAQALYDQAADLQKEGVGTGIDTLRAKVELQNEKQRLLEDRKSTRLNSSHVKSSYAVFCL